MKFYHDHIGLIHLISASLALLAGTWILIGKKGSNLHKKVGYVYFINMLILNATAFMIYRLFGGFGIFHIAALISLITVIAGMVPVYFKPKNWIAHHFSWMYWSVMGLYAAFASEVLTRVPESPFFAMVGIATGLIMIVASLIFRKKKNKWLNQFKINNDLQSSNV